MSTWSVTSRLITGILSRVLRLCLYRHVVDLRGDLVGVFPGRNHRNVGLRQQLQQFFGWGRMI